MSNKNLLLILAGGLALFAVALALNLIRPYNFLNRALFGNTDHSVSALYNEQVAIGEAKRAELAANGSDGRSIGYVDPNGSLARSNNYSSAPPKQQSANWMSTTSNMVISYSKVSEGVYLIRRIAGGDVLDETEATVVENRESFTLKARLFDQDVVVYRDSKILNRLNIQLTSGEILTFTRY